MRQIGINGYRVRSERSESLTRELIEGVCQQSLPCYLAHRDNRRTLSAQFQMHGERFVLKIPRARNARYWERLLTLFRGSDLSRVYQGMLDLHRTGILGPRPILIAEKKHFGIIVDSFLIYEFLEGETCTSKDAEAIAKSVLILHDLSLMRRDIHLGNFLIVNKDQIGMIDFRLSQPKIFRQIQLDIELNQMLHAIPETLPFIPQKRLDNYIFRIANYLYKINFLARNARRSIKKFFTPYTTTR
jgi:heptose II phosphotransferase